jgi:hypothetical protein
MLPTTKTPPKADASKKSTWASKIPDAIFIATDPGLDEIESFRVPAAGVCRTWEELIGYVDEIVKGGQFRTLIIDTIDMAWQLCSDAICKKYGVEYQNEGNLSFGKGRAMVMSEFQRLIMRVKTAGLGLVLISHAIEVLEENTTTGTTRSKWEPSLPKKAGIEISGLVDAILFADFDHATEQRVLRLKITPRYHAGCRGGESLPDKWSLSDYAGFIAAYTDSLKKNAESAGKPPAKPAPAAVPTAKPASPVANGQPAGRR